ncbi:hypothetical protein BJF96_g261 [Verticillium dahliae]|uniref:UBC core domain-containing protein n=1 Tax=Verticillium dahliae TaxID=27337 RepID=A0AA45ARY4_VERDA|nr:hypothetical protein BJF96_g261 [Verticillium dahliae]
MTRRKFRADVAAAINISIPGISSVGLGPDDGEVVCIYTSNRSAVQIPLRLTTASVDDYPQHQGFHGSTECDEIPSSIMGVLGRLVYSTQGRSVIDSLAILSNQLETALGSAATEQQSEDHVSVADATDSSPEDEIGGDTDVEFEDYDLEIHDNTTSGIDLHPIAAGSQNQVKRNVRLREDLAKAREVGFGIGLWPNDDIVSLSLRASKLGLSTETLTAWDIEPTEYIVLLFKYEDHYLPLETFATIQGKEKPMLFRVGQCTTYKPSLVTAQAAFNKQDQAASTLEDASDGNGDFDRLYMSNSLDLWMEQEFAALLLLRIQSNLSWDNAKLAMLAHSKSDHLRGPTSAPEAVTADQEAEVLISPTAPYKLNQDYLIRNPESDSSGLLQISNLSNAKQERSLPLVAMQFALRYLVNCTKYCMVCHLKTSDAFAAITPYVCDNPLCLYQYMSLGFGPSIEHEIISQPLVVDLLISCFMINKEQRLIEAVRANSLTKAAPTIFAWHGSSLGNWHSIIRQGLDFSRVVNGRAFGHGVYFSPHWETSSSYAAQPAQTDTYGWFRSQLQPSSVISLCEIVNRPDAFVSNNPHYVVADVDWIQCRYLIVQSAMAPAMRPQDDIELVPVTPGTAYLKQDPKYRVYGPWTRMLEVSGAGPPVGIPETASSGARLSQQLTSPVENVVLEDVETGDPSVEDCDFEKCVRDIGPEIGGPEATSTTAVILNSRKTDFRPGTLDIKSLPKLPAPTWAMDSGRRALGHELKKLQKVQATTPLHELGWYIDFNSIENLFHWIVELHSFDPRLHLAQDMKSAGARSIVLELRFGRSYPLTPPFVRVIRPRFLPFMAGGGGHVTNGGAMCMELLTNSGWSPATSLENVLVQVRMAMSGEDPQPARLEDPVRYRTRVTDYGIDEAIVAFRRSALAHGWAIPSDLEETARLA